jgi:sugar diacid utilization regulator
VLFDALGKLIAPTDCDARTHAIARRLWEEYSRVGGTIGPIGVIESSHERFYYQKVFVHGTIERVLAARVAAVPASDIIDTSLSFAQRLLALDLLRSQERLLVRRRIRSLLLDDFLSERGTSQELLRRLREEDIDLERAWRIVLMEMEPRSEAEGRISDENQVSAFDTAVLDVLDKCLGPIPGGFLSLLQGKTIVLLMVIGNLSVDRLKSTLGDLRRQLEAFFGLSVIVGCSGPSAGLVRIGAAKNQASEALRLARTEPEVEVQLFENLPRALRFLNGQDPEAMVDLYNRLVTPLAMHDARHRTSLLPTLRALYANNLSAHETAEALFIHRNTLRKRLERVESILGVDLDSLDDVLEIHLALRVGELHPELTAN